MAVDPSVPSREPPAELSVRRTRLLAVGLAGLVLLLWGGYGNHWSWTGINGHTATLWDWLKLLLLPVAFAVLPIWLRPDARLKGQVKLAALVAGGLLFVLALAGYLVPWRWTGFRGNHLWDWLNLVALPLAVALAPLAPEIRARWARRHSTLALAGTAVFLTVVLAGYLVPWSWTGFTGNTVWDWLHLLVLPLLVPTVLIPTLRPVAAVPMTPVAAASGTRVAAPGTPAAPSAGPGDGEPAAN